MKYKNREDGMKRKMERIKFLISSYYFNSLLSCPYWWNNPNAPVSVEAMKYLDKVEMYLNYFEEAKEERRTKEI